MEVFLQSCLDRMLPPDCSFRIHASQGKHALLRNIHGRLRGYRRWRPPNTRIVIVVDRDSEDCHQLKNRLENAASKAGLLTRTQAGDDSWQVVNRIAIEELEAWYFGDWEAVRCAFPRVPENIPRKAPYRDPDAIRGGTWEAFERVLQRGGYFKTGLGKAEAARAIAGYMKPARNTSHSFAIFFHAISEVTS